MGKIRCWIIWKTLFVILKVIFNIIDEELIIERKLDKYDKCLDTIIKHLKLIPNQMLQRLLLR